MSRLEKTRLVSTWEVGLNNFKVCTRNEGLYNCGTCEKCSRTKLQLYAINNITYPKIFHNSVVDGNCLDHVSINNNYAKACYIDILPYFKKSGRNDLVKAIENLIKNKYKADMKKMVIDKTKKYKFF
jgi:hypothetical protein